MKFRIWIHVSDEPIVHLFEKIDWWAKRQMRLGNFVLAITFSVLAIATFAATVELHLSDYAGRVVYPTVTLFWLTSIIAIVPELIADANANNGTNPLRTFVWMRLAALAVYLMVVLPMYVWSASAFAAKVDTAGGFFFIATFYFLSCDLHQHAKEATHGKSTAHP
jgi:uncharacterized membrane protein